MDVIQQIIQGSGEVLAKLLLRKEESHEIIVEQPASAKEVGVLVWSLLAAEDYGAAEKLLLKQLNDNFDFELYNTGLEFFNALDKMSDKELEARAYSRRAAEEGAKKLFAVLKKKCGLKT